ncbi:MAG: hypothetical protein ACI4UM_01075 [Succinivibrio sp.]
MKIFNYVLFAAILSLFLPSGAHCHGVPENAHADRHVKKIAPPNTIAGTKKVARVGDYVLLKGYFVKQVDDVIFEFSDDSAHALFVTFEGVKIPDNLSSNYEYFLWGQILRNDKTTILQALFLSDRKSLR